ncbi:hypothetical protein N9X23_02085 [Flavobacteriales bacterium]|nr:hypothetical protein [Flavobacteriales bacterium]
MGKNRIYIIIYLILQSLIGYSQHHYSIDTLEIHQQIKSFGDKDVNRSFKKDFFRSIVFKNDSTLYYNPNGSLHLYKIKLGEDLMVEKLSEGTFHGHNFKRLLFLYNDVVYSYGGEGLFNVNSSLIYFDEIKKGWFEREIKNYPLDSRFVVNSWVINDKLRVLLNLSSEFDENTSKFTKYSFGYIDLTNFEYHKDFVFNYPDYSNFIIPESEFIYDSEEYTIYGYREKNNHCRYSLFDKNTSELFRTPFLENTTCIDGFSYLYTNKSMLYYRKDEGVIDSVNINSFPHYNNKNHIEIYRSNIKKYSFLKFLLLGICTILIIGLLIYKKRKSNIVSESDKELKEIEDKMVELKGRRISKDELDDVLGISHYTYETNKQWRSTLITQLNERGKIKIDRVRKQEDKRYFEYLIS